MDSVIIAITTPADKKRNLDFSNEHFKIFCAKLITKKNEFVRQSNNNSIFRKMI